MNEEAKINFFKEGLSLLKYQKNNVKLNAHHDIENVYNKTVGDLKKYGLNEIVNKDILDLGCGQRLPFSLLAASYGAKLTALDVE